MKVLFIGGTGNISNACSGLAIQNGIDLYILNRGIRKTEITKKCKQIVADINNVKELTDSLKGHQWDVVVNWIAYTPEDVKRDIGIFKGKTKQYIFISSASAYQKPLGFPIITESTPLKNPYWEYSRNKIKCEMLLNEEYRNNDFPATIVRPSLTYETVIPVAIGGWDEYTAVDRIKKGERIIVHGDGTSLWTITHSKDFAKGFVGLMGHQQAIGHPFHITSDEILTWDQIYNAVAEAVGAAANIIHVPSDFICDAADKTGHASLRGSLTGDKAVSAIFDNSKIKRFVPDFKAIIPFNKGIKDTIKWFEEKPERRIIRKETNQFINKVIEMYESSI